MPRQPLMKHVDPASNTKGREVLNRETVPLFASFIPSGGKVYNIGKHRMWDYSAYFNNPAKQCEYFSTDIAAGEEPDIVDDITQSRLETNSADGILFIGMDWDIPDPRQALAEVKRILKPGGRVVTAFAGEGDTRGGNTYSLEQVMNFHKEFLVDEISIMYGSNAVGVRYDEGPVFAYMVIARKSGS